MNYYIFILIPSTDYDWIRIIVQRGGLNLYDFVLVCQTHGPEGIVVTCQMFI